MYDTPRMRNCLICSVRISECAELARCFTKPTTWCRKCRFRKFCDVLAQSKDPADDRDAETESESDIEKDSQPSTSFLDHERHLCTIFSFFDAVVFSFSLIPSSYTGAPLLDRIKNGYSLLCLIRKTSEVLLIPTDFIPTQEEIDNNSMHFFPMTYSLIMPTAKVHLTAVWDFGNATFEDFKNLSVHDRYRVVSSAFKFIVLLDTAYRSLHYFPDCNTRLAGYMFSANDDYTETFLDSVPCEINKEEIAAVFRENAVKITELKEHLKRVAPSDAEFALLFGLTFWSNEISIACESMTPMVERNRKAIMDELHLLYTNQGKIDYAARAGELYDLLANVEEISTLADADLELYKLMNLFTEFSPE